MVIGYKSDEYVSSESEELLNNLAFMCYDDCGSNAKYEYYKEHLLNDYPNDKVEIVEAVEPVESSTVASFNGLMNSSWPMKSHDTRHTGLSPYSTADVNGLEKWRFYIEDWVGSAPVIDSDGVIYFGCHGRELYAVYPNCSEKWNFHVNGWITSAPAIAEEGIIYIGSWDCGLYAINPDGSEKWRFGSGGGISSSPAITDDGTIYFGVMGPDYDGRIYALNPNGTEKWHYDTGYWIESDPAIGDDGTIYIGSGDSYLYAMNPNGSLKWRFKTGDEIHNDPSIAEDGTIYIGSFDEHLYAINPDGTMKWSYDIVWGASGGTAIGEDGTIYIGTDNVYAIWPNGSTRWIYDLGSHYIGECSPAISADGTIYIGTHNDGGDIIAINPDGTLKWRKGIGFDWIDSSPCIGPDGTVYIGSASHQGFLHAFGPVSSNEPPNAPSISGETNGEVGEDYWYTISAVDPDNNPVQFYIDWGDGDEGWYREWASGAPTYAEHSWNEEDTYTIGIKVKDTLGEESNWTYLEVTMPVNQPVQYPLLELFRERFPLLYQLFMRVLEVNPFDR